MLWVLKRTVLKRRSLEHQKHTSKLLGKIFFYNFTLIIWFILTSELQPLCSMARAYAALICNFVSRKRLRSNDSIIYQGTAVKEHSQDI